VEGGTAETFEVYGPGLPGGAYTLRITGETFEHTVDLGRGGTSENLPGR
jgi:hypothetical protein